MALGHVFATNVHKSKKDTICQFYIHAHDKFARTAFRPLTNDNGANTPELYREYDVHRRAIFLFTSDACGLRKRSVLVTATSHSHGQIMAKISSDHRESATTTAATTTAAAVLTRRKGRDRDRVRRYSLNDYRHSSKRTRSLSSSSPSWSLRLS